MKASNTLKQKDIHKDEMKLSASTKVDKGLMSALVDAETGLLRPGAMPAVQAANPGGCKTLLNTMTQAPRTKFIVHLFIGGGIHSFNSMG